MRMGIAVVSVLCACGGDDDGVDTDGAVDGASIDTSMIDTPLDANSDARVAGECWVFAGGTGGASFMDGTGGATGTARFNFPQGAALDGAGNLYVGDLGNHRVRKLAPDGTTTTLAGNGTSGYMDGTGGPTGTTQFVAPAGIAVDASGNVYTSDYGNHRVRKIAPDGTTTTLTGTGTNGSMDGTGGTSGTAQLENPNHMTIDSAGNVYVISWNRVRKIAPDGTTTTLAGNGTGGYMDGTGGANGTTQFAFSGESVGGLAVDSAGNVYAADFYNDRIRKIAPDGTTTTLAGGGTNSSMPDGTGTGAYFARPFGLTLGPDGNLYTVEYASNRIRKITLGGVVTTIPHTCSNGELRGIAIRDNVLYAVAGSVAVVLAIQLPPT